MTQNLPNLLGAAVDAAHLPTVIEQVTGQACPPHGGTIHDPIPGHEERTPSFSVFQRDGVWFFKRRGQYEIQGTAWHFLLACGFSPEDARQFLIGALGVSPTLRIAGRTWKPHPPLSPLARALQFAERVVPLDRQAQHQAWQQSQAPVGPAAAVLRQRGLLHSPVLHVGELTRGAGWGAQGALTFGVYNPAGQLTNVKFRNPEGIEPRYAQRLPGAPGAWCSPRYGRGAATLVVEGELNAAAACHAARFCGLSLDVQGLPGADNDPYPDGLHRDVLLYLDDDKSGNAAAGRLTELCIEAGASRVHRIPPFAGKRDFCDVLSEAGPEALADLLRFPERVLRPGMVFELGRIPASYTDWPLMPSRTT